MKLSDLEKEECGKIISISSDSVLKSRFSSFGITKGVTIYVLEYTIAKSTMEVRVNNTKIALRLSEARFIEVEKTLCEK